MIQRSPSLVARLFGRKPAPPPVNAAETLKQMARERRDEEAIAYRRQLFAQQPDLALPVLVELRMGETFQAHADPVHARLSFDRALQFTQDGAAQAVWLRLARLAQQLQHPRESELLQRLLADRTLDPDLRPKLTRRLAFLNGDTSWDMPAIGHVPPAPWEEPPPAATVQAAAPMDLAPWHDMAAQATAERSFSGAQAAADQAIADALLTSLEMEAPEPPAMGIQADAPAPAWGASDAPRWNPATPRRRETGPKRLARGRRRSVPLATIPRLDE